MGRRYQRVYMRRAQALRLARLLRVLPQARPQVLEQVLPQLLRLA